MVAAANERRIPVGLVLTGEAESWLPALEQIVGPDLVPYRVRGQVELLEVVEAGLADAAVLDEEAQWGIPVLQALRMIRQVDRVLPVVVVTRRQDRRWMEDALRLAAFSVLSKPLELESLLRQVQRLMVRIDAMVREEWDEER